MKNVKLSFFALALTLVVVSCQKNDFNEESAADGAIALSAADTIGWKTTNQWETADQETFSVQYFTIDDAAITDDVADNGLVLLYKKSGTAINALPFEESATGTESAATDENSNANYWYHQVTEGSLLISCDIYQNAKMATDANRFKYFIITPEKLESLVSEGHTTDELINLDYATASALLKEVN